MVEMKGIIVPIITPMREDESIYEEELRNQIKRLINAGVHGIFAFGTNGEGYILAKKEKEEILSIIIEECRGRIPVYAGTGCISTKETIELSLKAKELGADVISVITPSFAQASQEELYTHYKDVAEAVKMPMMLYNIPARTGNALSPITVEKLSAIPWIKGAKDSSGNFDHMLQYIERTRKKDFSILSGNDSLIYWNLLAGGCGGVSGCANVFPETMVGIYHRFQAGDLEGAQVLQDSIRPFRNCFQYGNPNTIVKAAVKILGYPVGNCRRPFHLLPEEGEQVLLETLKLCTEAGMR